MTVAIMQPYFLPYIGYWQLINAVDTFVIYDDVNYIKQGYINRNSILANEKAEIFTLELMGASSNKLIQEIEVGKNKQKLLKTIKQNYSKAPYFDVVLPIIENILMQEEKNLAKFLGYSLEIISSYLELKTQFLYSSQITKNDRLKAQDKILDLCKALHVKHYLNAIGGQKLYDKEIFRLHNIELNFIQTELVEYKQFNNEFVPHLSIIDIMMFNSKSEIKKMLNKYELA